MSSHQSPQEIRKGLKHPVIDGDGHWVEYAPVFAEKIRKVTGDLGGDGFLQSQRRIPDALELTTEQRKERGIAMEGQWGRQALNTRDRALLKRDVRLGKTGEARKMRREINADERAIRQARSGAQQSPNAKSMQPQRPLVPPQSQNQTNTNNATQQTPSNNR
jgi:hypothetical protein